MKPKFSIIIPIYNKAPYVRKALESILTQSYTNYEVVIIDDGSTDNSLAIANDFVKTVESGKWKVESQLNAGVAAARNNGVAASKGEYVCFLDADDWWESEMLEEMDKLIREYPDAGLYATNYIYYKPGKTHVALKLEQGYMNYPEAYLQGDAMPVWTGAACMPRKVFDEMGGFPVGVNMGEDFLLWAKTALHYKVAFCEKALAYYNNDVPASLRATRNVHEPEHNMLFHLEEIEREVRGKSEEVRVEWKALLDKLRVNGLMDYWLNNGYHNAAATELAKVDWSKQPPKAKAQYEKPIWVQKAMKQLKQIGSYCKQKFIKMRCKSMKKIKVIIDPRSNYLYGSFYVSAIKQRYGSCVRYDITPFKELGDIGKDLRFIVRDGDKEKKYFLYLNDSYTILEEDYAWCDVYGNVNANYAHYPKDKYPKQVSLVPSFGVRVEKSLFKTMVQAIWQLPILWQYVVNKSEWNKYAQRMECNRRQNLKHYFTRRYRAWKERLPISTYINDIPSEDNYIFFLSTLWYSNDENKNDETVNRRRANFIQACKSIKSITFEGGLLGGKASSNEKFSDVLAEQGEPFDQWIEKTKRSALVFNTPAFWECHGWKLGEYLALGKCIVSTKLSNDLPYPLEHGKNIHFVEDTEESMREAIEYILEHPDYRHQLEQGAKEYWEKYGTPEASFKLLLIE